ncbi:hypothetical protein NFI96_029966, partial [Prochilodus magdalenae]
MMFLCSLSLFIIMIENCVSQSISPLEEKVDAVEGETVTLSCSYEYSGGGTPYLHWYRQYPGSRPEFLLLTPESGGYVTKARMSIKVHKEEKKKVDLKISSAAVSDSVLYYCALQPTVTGNPDTLYRNWFYKLSSLGLRSSLCNWVLDFLTNRPQSVRIHNLSSSTTILSTGSPQGCVLSPLLFTLLTYDCSPIHSGCHIVKFADDTAVVGCITNSDESGYRQEVEHLEGWCRKNNLCINIKKTKEMIVDFRRGRHAHLPLHVGGSAVEVVSSYRYLGVHLSNNLTWSNNTSSLVRKAHQRLYFLRRLRQAGLGSSVLRSFYRCVVESVLCSSINVWHGSCSAADRKALQRVVKAAQ